MAVEASVMIISHHGAIFGSNVHRHLFQIGNSFGRWQSLFYDAGLWDKHHHFDQS
jgi:hypothetical protein